jgi:hypothetical protein
MPRKARLAKRAAKARKYGKDNALASAGGGRLPAGELPFGPCATGFQSCFLREAASETVLNRKEIGSD